ncbi:MAG: FCD domain-containing protein [Deltaproteobacteria bacterium]|nr:FCD domain-containing protein [Deltaproteobacteria bacterium]
MAKPRAAFDLRAEERAPLSVLVSRQLRHAIVSGKVSIGTELPSEKELTRELGVGRSTVREALRILQAQGLLSGGDTVSTRRPRVSTEEVLSLAAAQAMENVVRLAQVPLADLVELRVLLEGAAVEAAARTKPALADARDAIAAMEAAGADVEAFRAADLRFHRALADAGGNAAFPLVMGALRAAISAHLGEALHRAPQPRRAITKLTREHTAILDAITAGHGTRARTLITRHIRGFYRERAR